MKIDKALLMAAGKGSRIRPISSKIPKPLIPVNGTPMIEGIINRLNEIGVKEIIITVGYQKEKYYYLKDKYSNIELVENKEYTYKNTISSLWAAKDYIRNNNVIILESDLYLKDPSDIKLEFENSTYFICSSLPQNYEWGFVIENEIIKKIVRPQKDVYLNHYMYGIAYWSKSDLEKLIKKLEEVYNNSDFFDKAYDEVANDIFHEINVKPTRIEKGKIYEIDNISNLVEVDQSYNSILDKIPSTQIIEDFLEKTKLSRESIIDMYVNPGRSANNSSYVFETTEGNFLYRIPGKGTEKFCDRNLEIKAYEKLAKYNIFDEIIYIDDSGIKISKYYKNSRIPLNDFEELRKTMKVFRTLHSLPLEFPRKESLFDRAKRYNTYVLEVGGEEYYLNNFKIYQEELIKFEEYWNNLNVEFVFTHGDASINNILILKNEETPKLIDLEFPTMSDSFDDLATFSVDANFLEEDIINILELYLGRKSTDEEKYHVLGLTATATLMWYSWAAYKSKEEKNKKPFINFRNDYDKYLGEILLAMKKYEYVNNQVNDSAKRVLK